MKSPNMLVAGAAASALFLGGCASEVPAAPAPPSPDVTFLNTTNVNIDHRVEQNSERVVDWLRTNPNRRIVSITGEMSTGERPGTYGLQMVTKEGANADQSCEPLLLTSEDMKFDGPEAYDNRHIQQWHDANPNKEIVTAFSVYTTARLAGHVVCFNNKPQ